MSSRLILKDTKGTVKYRKAGGTYETLNGCKDLEQGNTDSWDVLLVGDAACEFHRRKGLAAGICPAAGRKKSLCLKAAAKDGDFVSIKAKSRPRQRSLGEETEPPLEGRKRKLKWNPKRTVLTYSSKSVTITLRAKQ